MPTKEQLIEEIDNNIKKKAVYSASEAKHLVRSVQINAKYSVNEVKFGDVVISHNHTNKARPAVVISHTKRGNILVPLTTTEDYMSLKKCESRLFNDSYFSKNMVLIPDEAIKDYVAGIYDNKRELTELKKLIRKQFKL